MKIQKNWRKSRISSLKFSRLSNKYNGELFKKTNRFRYLEIHSNGGLDKDITMYLAQGFPFEFFESAQVDPIEAKKKLQAWASGKNIDTIDDSDESDYSMNSDDDQSDQNKDENKLESSQESELDSNQESHPNKLEDIKEESNEESNEESKEQSKEESMETSKEEANKAVSNLDKDNDAKGSKEHKDPEKATIESKEESSMELASINPLNEEEDDDVEESDSSSNEDEDSKDTSEELSQEVELKFTKIESERLLSLGLFFLKSMFAMIEDESGNVKDDQSFDS